MTLNERLLRLERTQADHEQQLGGDRLARIENKLDALLHARLANLGEDEPEGETEPSAIDLDTSYPNLKEMPPHRSVPL